MNEYNFICEEKVKIVINKLEMECYRVYMTAFDLVYFYTYVLKSRLGWSTNVVFGLDYLFVNSEEDSMQTFYALLGEAGINVYKEKQLQQFIKAKSSKK